MKVCTTHSPKFQVTAPDQWSERSTKYHFEKSCLALQRYVEFVPNLNAHGWVESLLFHAQRCGKGAETRAKAKTLLSELLEKGRDDKLGKPYSIVMEKVLLVLAAVSYMSRDPVSETTRYIRLWRAVKGRITVTAEFEADS